MTSSSRRNGLAGDVEVDLTVRWSEYHAAAKTCQKTVVFGGKAKRSGLWVPDKEVAAYVAAHSGNLIGFFQWILRSRDGRTNWSRVIRTSGMKGIKLLPMYAGFRPNDRESRLSVGNTRRSTICPS